MSSALSIPPHLNGPLDSGNGGYAAGVIATLIDGPAEVSLRSPVPLGTQLKVRPDDDGSIRLLGADDALIAEGKPVADPNLDVPPPVTVDQARVAAAGYRGLSEGVFSKPSMSIAKTCRSACSPE